MQHATPAILIPEATRARVSEHNVRLLSELATAIPGFSYTALSDHISLRSATPIPGQKALDFGALRKIRRQSTLLWLKRFHPESSTVERSFWPEIKYRSGAFHFAPREVDVEWAEQVESVVHVCLRHIADLIRRDAVFIQYWGEPQTKSAYLSNWNSPKFAGLRGFNA